MKLRSVDCCITYICSNDKCKGIKPFKCVNGTPRHDRALFPARKDNKEHTLAINRAINKARRSSIIFVQSHRTYMVKCQKTGCDSYGAVKENIEPFDCTSCGNTYCSATCEQHMCSTYHVPAALQAMRDTQKAPAVDTTRATNPHEQKDKPATTIDLTIQSQDTCTDSQTNDTINSDQDSGQDSQPNIYCYSDNDDKDDDDTTTTDAKDHVRSGSDVTHTVGPGVDFVDDLIEKAKCKTTVNVNGRQILLLAENQSDMSYLVGSTYEMSYLEVLMSCS